MLSALLNTIQSSLGSRGFLIGSVFPIVTFTCANGWLAYRASPAFRAWLATVDSLPQQALLSSALITAVFVAAYVLSAAASAILEMFEGKHWPISWFRWWLHRIQLAQLRHLEANYWSCVHELGDLEDETDFTQHPPVVSWIDRLNEARRGGPRLATCVYPATLFERLTWHWLQRGPDVGQTEIASIRRRRAAGRFIPAALLGAAVAKLIPLAKTNALDDRLPAARALRRDCDDLVEAIRFSRDRYQAERIRLFTLRRFRFPVDAETAQDRSAIILAPTTVGNIGRTIRSYAQKHYGFDVDVLWTRLQSASQSSDKFYASLQDAKVQLDFFVACTWLTGFTTVVWLLAELTVFHSRADFLTVGIVGPLVAVAAYALLCRAYNVFADTMRTCVDLFRFKVLSDLHLPLPPGLEEEKIAWQDLASVMGYENLESERGDAILVTYKH